MHCCALSSSLAQATSTAAKRRGNQLRGSLSNQYSPHPSVAYPLRCVAPNGMAHQRRDAHASGCNCKAAAMSPQVKAGATEHSAAQHGTVQPRAAPCSTAKLSRDGAAAHTATSCPPLVSRRRPSRVQATALPPLLHVTRSCHTLQPCCHCHSERSSATGSHLRCQPRQGGAPASH